MATQIPRLPDDSPASIGMWSQETAADVIKMMSINASPAEITKDQMIQLYAFLYPYISGEFVHRDTMMAWYNALAAEFTAKIQAMNVQLEALTSAVKSHTHASHGTPDASSLPSVTAPSLAPFSSIPEAFNQGDTKITEGSSYAIDIPHRNPAMTSTLSTPYSNFVVDFNKALKFTPFDVGGGSLITGDIEYVNIKSLSNLG